MPYRKKKEPGRGTRAWAGEDLPARDGDQKHRRDGDQKRGRGGAGSARGVDLGMVVWGMAIWRGHAGNTGKISPA